MKLTVLRLLGILVAVVVLGTVALAVAIGAQSPGASQIPTVVTNQPTATPAALSLVATSTPPSVETTAKPKPVKSPAKRINVDKSSHTNADSGREVVTPKLREGGNDDRSRKGESDSSASSGVRMSSRISGGSVASVAAVTASKSQTLETSSGRSSEKAAKRNRSERSASNGRSERVSAPVSPVSSFSRSTRRATPTRSDTSARVERSSGRTHIVTFGNVGGHRSSGKNVVGRTN
jgi:hypothetical protein